MGTRRERVVLELEDAFTAGAIRAAAATELLDKRLDSLGKRSVQTSRAQASMERSVASAGNTAGGSSRQIDRYSGRIGLLVDLLATIGPSTIPIAAVAIPAVTGLASALGMLALGGGTAILAFNGVGDALDKVNKARLEPTTANLGAAHTALEKLGPDARNLVAHLANLSDEVKVLRDAAAGGVLPGVDAALDALLTRAPEVEKILHRIGTAVGDMLADGAESLASDRWDDFFDFIKTEAPPALRQLGEAVGNIAHAAAELWMAFGPLNGDFLDWLVTGTERLDAWAEGLSKTQGFQEFVDYIRDNGPQVGETLGAIAMALLDIVEAGAPIGAATLPILEAVAETVSAIADSDLGTPLLAFLALTRAVSLFDRGLQTGPIKSIRQLGPDLKTMANTSVVAFGRSADETERYNKAAQRTKSTLGGLAKGAGVIGGLAFAQSGLADKVGLSNTAMLASLGLMAGPWGAAVGGAVGLVMDLTKGTDDSTLSVEALTAALDEQSGALTRAGYEQIAAEVLRYQDALDAAGISQTEAIRAIAEGGDLLDGVLGKVQTAIDGNQLAAARGADGLTDFKAALTDGNSKINEAKANLDAKKAADDAAADAERDHAAAIGDTRGALEGLNPVQDTNKDGIIDNTDAILDNIAAMEDRTDAINAAFDAETAYQRSLQVGADREKDAAEIREQIADAESEGAKDRAELQRRLADAQGDLASAKTPSARKSAQESIRSIQGQISDSLGRQADTIKRLREQLAEYLPTLDKHTKAGQANRDVLSEMAAGWNNLSGEQQNAKGKYEEARKAIIDQAKQFGATGKQAKWYADNLLDIPPRVQTKILLDQQRAQEMLDAFSEAFNGLDGKVAKTIIQLRIDQITGPGGKLDNGGKSGPASPGKGTPRTVIPRQRLTAADVTRGSHAITSQGPSADDIASAVSRHARPMFDNVSFNSEGDFERAMQLADRLAAKGGA